MSRQPGAVAGSQCPGPAGAAGCWEPKGLRDLVPMDRQGKREARPGPAWLLTKRTIQAPGSLDSTDTLLLKSRQPKPVCKALSVRGPSFRGKSWAEPRRGMWEREGRQIDGDTEPGRGTREDSARRQGHGARLCRSDNMRNRNDFWILLVLGCLHLCSLPFI